MSLLSSLNTGATGLAASTIDLEVTGDNIANANTVGFKRSRASFADTLSQTLVGGAQLGLGTKLESIRSVLLQGSLLNTGVATDLAVTGDGWFVVRGAHDGREGSFYTRDGQFTLDKDGRLVNAGGLAVQGFAADASGVLSSVTGDLAFGTATSAPSPTGRVTLRANLQADAVVPPPWDPQDPAATSNFSSTITVYDALGTAHDVSTYFRKTASGSWEWHAVTDGAGVQGGTAGTASEVASGTLTFDTSGKLSGSTQAAAFTPTGQSQAQALSFDFAGLTQFAGPSSVSFASQDGFGAGSLASVSIDTDGRVNGAFTNGQSRVLGAVALATFGASDRMQKAGDNLLAATPDSGAPVVGVAGTGERGSIISGALEQSNVDLATEFVRMMTAQRQFQANSKTLTTADALLGELIQLKR